MADRHYNRQKIGAPQFVPSGRCVVLQIPHDALWVTSWPMFTRHAWPGAWINSLFRNERPDVHLSSSLITEAIAATRFYWTPPPEGLITFIDEGKTRKKRDPGRCYLRAGFHRSGTQPCCADKPERTIVHGLLALHMAPEDMPAAKIPLGQTERLAL